MRQEVSRGVPSPRKRSGDNRMSIQRAMQLPGYDAALARECPTCHAGEGILCVSHVTGLPFAFHAMRWEYDAIIEVECPFCWRQPGELCVTRDGNEFAFHRDRMHYARGLKKAAKSA